MKKGKSPKVLFNELSEDKQFHVRSIVLEPVADLAEQIGRFQPPFDYLKIIEIGFSTEVRFLLNYVLSGDKLALEAFEEFITSERTMLLKGRPSQSEFAKLEAFDQLHHAERVALLTQELTPLRAELMSANRIDCFGDELTLVVKRHLSVFGFLPSSKGFQSEVAGQPLIIKSNKGTWRPVVYLSLFLPNFATRFSIGTPFLYSEPFLPKYGTSVASSLDLFFSEFAKIYPALKTALEIGCENAAHYCLENSETIR